MTFLGHTLSSCECDTLESVEYAKNMGYNFFQIFLSAPDKYRTSNFSIEELKYFNQQLQKYKMKMVIHANFMLNFCNPPESYIHKKASEILIDDLNKSIIIGAIGVIVHMGKKLKMSFDEAFYNYVLGIRNVLRESDKNSKIIFETGAGVGTEICTSIHELSKLYNKFTFDEQKRIKFCIDTCHVFSAGYDLSNPAYIPIFCQMIDDLLGWDNIICIHLNDSKCELNSHKDRHADISSPIDKCYIRTLGLRKFIKICNEKNIPIVMETPCDTISKIEQYKIVKSWLN